MKILVTDACIFIDLFDCDACGPFFQLPYEVRTTYQVWQELDRELQRYLKKWINSEKLVIMRLDDNFISQPSDKNLSKSLSIADLSIWAICNSKDHILLTSDGMLRKMAKRHALTTHGLLWIFDEFLEHQTLSQEEVISKLDIIFNQNIYYRSDQKLMKAYKKMRRRYEK